MNGGQSTLSKALALAGERKLARVSSEATMITAIRLMRKNEFAELLVEDNREKPRAFTSYSVISKLLSVSSSDYEEVLQSPCGESSLAAGTINVESDLLSLFHVFESTTFGFAFVHDNSRRIVGKISTKNLLALFAKEVLASKLSINDVLSAPIFSMPRKSKLTDCLHAMESRKIRKIQITGTDVVISDKQILSFVFDEKRLEQVLKTPRRLLDDTLEDLDGDLQVQRVDGERNISEAAKILAEKGHDFLLSDRGIVTPWDLTIKPWRLGELEVFPV